ncbi:MAG: Exodeoxyribonuclease V beta chain [Candidatus Accumulibacter appositus]|uniref:RecBCD enzyme subunit RecB n=1 Tax=Candidatus Accumulibacter appositus TaxID=1454003 RepID=A0A011QHQ9_9PROT|nr:UvrD-helicase domain-containing protein [Accumulibacter sp.]EXI78369.1 MAG: Exodeoxyribonuclease V beta chain [Candidatus Accumulibacter appositus]HRF06619.1 UvrD-helicase domain-containing protein [Accumulibacter sp.]
MSSVPLAAGAATLLTANAAPAALDALRFPLRGSRLIEASAGTGKTYTIAALYVRLVLGHGGEDAFGRALTPGEILVVTFTEAATQELRDRIRHRLAEAAACFRVDPGSVSSPSAGQDLLHELRAEYSPEQWPACARKLQLAAEAMDEAAVSTIHGWCNRMLREHAFDSDSLFTQTLETDQRELLGEVVRDYWRSFMVALAAEAVAELRQWWSGPEALQGSIRDLVDYVHLLDELALPPAEALEKALGAKRQRLAELKAPWLHWLDELQLLLDGARDNKQFNGAKLKKNNYDDWLQKLARWRDERDSVSPGLTDSAKRRLTPLGLAEVWKAGDPPAHPALEAIAALDAELAALPNARQELLCHAARWVAGRFASEQARRAQMGFNDLLTRLDAALHGAKAVRLAAIIRRQFPAALIDEFQDTDPVQYRIFDAVYRIADNVPDTALILIGDPKQAIYAFRGADIHTYLAARRACADRLHTLKTNFRSTGAMVAASNHCFAVAEASAAGSGAFLFRREDANPVPFIAAEAKGRADAWQADGQPLPALTTWHLPANADGKPLSKDAYLEQMGAACASEMVRLLNLGQVGQAGFVGPAGAKWLRPADMAVLVNNRQEADAIRAALAQRGLRSVYLSDKDSVFQSPQAAELQYWLAACAEPDDARLLRAALATSTLDLSWQELDRLNHDELAWEARVLQFRAYRDCWRRQGVLPMLRRLLNDFHLPERLLGQGRAGDDGQGGAIAAHDANSGSLQVHESNAINAINGERILTNVLHLAELLQQASTLIDGEHALIRYLAEQGQDAASNAGDARQLRLESDADRVQVVTVHKSKGLEYPLVFLPFACNYRLAKGSDLPLKWHDEEGRLQLSLAADPGVVEKADGERLAEDLRKLYVALTRARYATWVGVAPLTALERSALAYLLGGGQAIAAGDSSALAQALQAWRDGCPHIVVAAAPAAGSERFAPCGEAPAVGAARRSQRVAGAHWWIASYSALKTEGGSGAAALAPAPAAETPNEAVFQEALRALAAQNAVPEAEPVPLSGRRPAAVAAASEVGSLHDFPRGAEAGTFLHDLLEAVARQGFGIGAGDQALRRDMIARRCQARGWVRWIEQLTVWQQHFLSTPMQLGAVPGSPATAIRLCELDASMAEMEFWLAVHGVATTRIDALVCQHTLDGAPRPALQPAQLNGMLKGFMDLLFEHQGRYYVADYKSNWLGPDDAAYTAAAMRAAILHARYDLQYVLYLLALHRLLKSRLPDYDYDRHVGGAVYLFLRGAYAPSQGLHFERPPRALIEALDALFARCGGREIAGALQ